MSKKNKKEKFLSNRDVINFGLHLMIDGYGGNFEKLNDGELVKKCLSELPEKIGMKKLAPPQVFFAPPLNEKDSGGYSGYVVINESHISCHTFPFRKFVSIDVYTCSNSLNCDFIENFFKKAFELNDLEINFVKRGTRFPSKDLVSNFQNLEIKNKKEKWTKSLVPIQLR